MKGQIKKIVLALKNNPNTVLGNVEGFCSYRFFLEGYFYGLDTTNKTFISREFSRFVNRTENGIDSSNVFWSKVFDLKYHENSDDEKIKILFDLLEPFFDEYLQ
jgi:hypothetical protein